MMWRISWSTTLLLTSVSLSCGFEKSPAEPDQTESAPIVDGQNDLGHPAAVALTLQGTPFCSGTLVTSTVVVTAAHCIFPGIGIDPPTQISVYFGPDVTLPGTFIDVVEGRYNPLFDIDNADENEDVAVLRLASPAPVAPVAMGNLPTTGQPVTLVGFGLTSAGGDGAGTKRMTSVPIDAEQPKTFSMLMNPSGTCNGDSGGSAFYDDGTGEKLVGIHTRSDCQTGMLDERVDVHEADFIQPFIDQFAACGNDGACASGCQSPDPDCPCADDGFCTSLCTNPSSDPDCMPQCKADGHCVKACAEWDPDCAHCVDDGICEMQCQTSNADPDCPSASVASSSASSSSESGAGTGGASQEPRDERGGGCSVGLHRSTSDSEELSVSMGLGFMLILMRRKPLAASK